MTAKILRSINILHMQIPTDHGQASHSHYVLNLKALAMN